MSSPKNIDPRFTILLYVLINLAIKEPIEIPLLFQPTNCKITSVDHAGNSMHIKFANCFFPFP